MKVQLTIDTKNNSTILSVDKPVELGKLVEVAKKLLPNNEWKKAKLEVKTEIVWHDRIIYKERDWWPTIQPYYTGDFSSTNTTF